ncbi:hypothetical protein [Burkholderia glumae]|uniref:hypothetical protein n=1 Tax=Burkholderia glumae TaxID=337 RepID=UPI002151A26A|nr:hypothetical protein [Burkholderia glumae]
MNISNFTKNSLIASLVFFLLIPLSHSEQLSERTNFKNSEIQISTECSDKDGGTNCTISAVADNKKRELIVFPFAPSDIKLESGVFIIIFPCGPECSATYFYSSQKGSGGPFPRVISYSVGDELAVSLARNPLPVYRIYSKQGAKPAFTIKLDTGKGQDLVDAVKNVTIGAGKISITYIDQKGDEKTAIRKIGN